MASRRETEYGTYMHAGRSKGKGGRGKAAWRGVCGFSAPFGMNVLDKNRFGHVLPARWILAYLPEPLLRSRGRACVGSKTERDMRPQVTVWTKQNKGTYNMPLSDSVSRMSRFSLVPFCAPGGSRDAILSPKRSKGFCIRTRVWPNSPLPSHL